MNFTDFQELSTRQQQSMVLAMHLRIALNEFHRNHLADQYMPELNSTIRYAIYEFYETVSKSEEELRDLVDLVPDYWEVPGRDPKPSFSGAYLGGSSAAGVDELEL
jgi:hypothetical protein